MRLRSFYDRLNNTIELVLIQDLPGGRKRAAKLPSYLDWKDLDDSYSLPSECILKIPQEFFIGSFFEDFERAISEAGGSSQKQKENLKKLEGLEAKVEAQSYHLEDMRKMAFDLMDLNK